MLDQQQLNALVAGARLSIDYGKSRTGIAHAASGSQLALPVATLSSDEELMTEITEIVARYQVTVIYLGLPKLLSGQAGEAVRMVMRFARDLKTSLPELRVRLIDERLTTVSAAQKLEAAGIRSREARSRIDQQAAVEILQQALAIEERQGILAGNEFL